MQDGVSIASLGHGKETTLGSVTRSGLRGDSAASPAAGRWLHLSSLAMETIGAVIFYWQGLPMYREISADPSAYASRETPRLWWLVGIALIQVGYWIRYRTAPVLPQVSNTALRHIVLFLGQMVFTLPTAVFSFVFISRKLSPEVPVIGYVLTVGGTVFHVLIHAGIAVVGKFPCASREKTRRIPELKPGALRGDYP